MFKGVDVPSLQINTIQLFTVMLWWNISIISGVVPSTGRLSEYLAFLIFTLSDFKPVY